MEVDLVNRRLLVVQEYKTDGLDSKLLQGIQQTLRIATILRTRLWLDLMRRWNIWETLDQVLVNCNFSFVSVLFVSQKKNGCSSEREEKQLAVCAD